MVWLVFYYRYKALTFISTKTYYIVLEVLLLFQCSDTMHSTVTWIVFYHPLHVYLFHPNLEVLKVYSVLRKVSIN